MHGQYQVANQKGRDHLRRRPKWEDNIKADLTKYSVLVWTEFNWLKTESNVRLL
jgi:hypothetical protein